MVAFDNLSSLSRVEDLIRSTFASEAPYMTEIPSYLLGLGGKRIRPTLTLLIAQALGAEPIPDTVIDVAAGIELIHMATLLHDDIIDHSTTRRHRPSPLAKYGIPYTLLSGDFLLVRAFGLCARLDKIIIQKTEEACIELVEGESLETAPITAAHTRLDSLKVAEKKTAALFRLGAFSAGHLVQRNPQVTQLLENFGKTLGIAFQILDDVLDVSADEATLGKRPGMDIRERKPSMVNVVWLESGSSLSQRLLSPPEPELEEALVQEAFREIKNSPVLNECRRVAADLAREALKSLDDAVILTAKSSLDSINELKRLVTFTLERLT